MANSNTRGARYDLIHFQWQEQTRWDPWRSIEAWSVTTPRFDRDEGSFAARDSPTSCSSYENYQRAEAEEVSAEIQTRRGRGLASESESAQATNTARLCRMCPVP